MPMKCAPLALFYESGIMATYYEISHIFIYMAHKKAGGSTVWGRDSQSKRLGIKLFAGELAKIGSILVRQRGTKYRPGKNVKKGSDDTLYSLIAGVVEFSTKKFRTFDGSLKRSTVVHVK